MSLTDKILDVAKGQVIKNPIAQEALKVTETLGINNLTKTKLTKEETQVQLDLFKKNFENIAKLAKVEGDMTKSVDKAINNKDGFFSELALQWFEKGNYEDNVAKIIKALQDLKVAKKLPETLDLTGLEKNLLGVAPSPQQIALGAIPLIGSWFTSNGSTFKSLNETLGLINEELQPKLPEEKDDDGEENQEENDEFNEGEHIKIDGKELLGIDVSNEAKRFVDYAETYEDEQYVWGGNGKKGVDCSGLIQQCLKKGGISIDRTAATQIKDRRLNDRSIEDAQLGDLIFFENKNKNRHGQITHVGIIKGRLENGNLVIYDASRNKEQVSTRVIKSTSDKFEYHIKDTSDLLKDLKTENMAYNEHTGESVDGQIQAA